MDKQYIYFIHVPKTAGTFVVKALDGALGQHFVREGHSVPPHCLRPWMERFGPVHYSRVPRDKCFTFTVVRNPFDLLVSMYRFGFPYWTPNKSVSAPYVNWPFKSFRDYLYKLLKYDDYPWIVPPQQRSLFFQLYDDGGNFIPDVVLKQERINESLLNLASSLDIEISIPTKAVNVSRSDTYRDYYDKEMKELVEHRYANDLNTFGYNFYGDDGRDLFSLKADQLDLTGKRTAASSLACATSEPPTGLKADIDYHALGEEVLLRYPAKRLVEHIMRRVANRMNWAGFRN